MAVAVSLVQAMASIATLNTPGLCSSDSIAATIFKKILQTEGTDPLRLSDMHTEKGSTTNILFHGLRKMELSNSAEFWRDNNQDLGVRFSIENLSKSAPCYMTANYNFLLSGNMTVHLNDLRIGIKIKIAKKTQVVRVMNVVVEALGELDIEAPGLPSRMVRQIEQKLRAGRQLVIANFRNTLQNRLNKNPWTVNISC
ncbi:uncharacterized protein LOC111247071 isoform X1 [Varroa destructor]|uniref:Uncharacterized protein n=1 Tax=Varroa destructor TaxID=109461 RepID=A0A7M7JM55_VARDE|nr:uncharacterized protein LOC111247071 isoform X1 [Varroa destructor]